MGRDGEGLRCGELAEGIVEDCGIIWRGWVGRVECEYGFCDVVLQNREATSLENQLYGLTVSW